MTSGCADGGQFYGDFYLISLWRHYSAINKNIQSARPRFHVTPPHITHTCNTDVSKPAHSLCSDLCAHLS